MPSVLDVIQINHPERGEGEKVHAFLVDTLRANEIRLARSIAESKRVMESAPQKIRLHNGVNHTVKKEVYCFDESEGRVSRKMFFRGAFPGSDYLPKAPNIFTRDLTRARQDKLERFQEAEREERGKREAAVASKTEYQAAIKTLQAVKQMINGRIGGLKKLTDTIEAEKSRIEQDEPDDAIDVLYRTDEIEKDIVEKLEQVQATNVREGEQNTVVEGLQTHYNEAKREQDTIAQKLERGSAESEEIRVQTHGIGVEMTKIATSIRRSDEAIAETRSKGEAALLKITTLDNHLQLGKEAAEVLGGRIETNRSAEDVKKVMVAKEKSIEKIKRQQHDKLPLAADFGRYEVIKKDRKRRIDCLVQYRVRFRDAFKKRKKYFNICKNGCKEAFAFYFNRNLEQRGFKGAVQVNYGNYGTGEMLVTVDRLSGGERSYSTLCMVIPEP
ncbi:hypothetical protein T484DRAFT_2124863 [Baffinella frigidus]|nr:hypothetical protein T484DRAFT_2124863 [Cryptophyta sp. CCMP2293]